MGRRNVELWAALLVILVITMLYLWVVIPLDSLPTASGLVGHSLGLVGFGLMLMTETLYSLRKRSRSARWGRMAYWLQFHIFTGLVGPYLVLLHTSWKFNGLAGVAMLLTVIVVASGFVGRYIYTAVPRTADGIELEAAELSRRIAAAEAALQQWQTGDPALAAVVSHLLQVSGAPPRGAALIWGRLLYRWQYRRRWQREKRRLKTVGAARLKELEELLNHRRRLQRQIASLAMARRLLALWHSVHVPLGVSLFTIAFVHIVAALYYATLLR